MIFPGAGSGGEKSHAARIDLLTLFKRSSRCTERGATFANQAVERARIACVSLKKSAQVSVRTRSDAQTLTISAAKHPKPHKSSTFNYVGSGLTSDRDDLTFGVQAQNEVTQAGFDWLQLGRTVHSQTTPPRGRGEGGAFTRLTTQALHAK